MRSTTAALLLASCLIGGVHAQTTAPTGPAPQRVDVTPVTAEAEVGQTLSFSAVGIAQDGSRMDARPSRWLTAPFDSAAANQDGTVTFFSPGLIKVGAVITGKTGFASVTVKPQAPARIEVDAPGSAIVMGAGIALGARAFVSSGDPLSDVQYAWRSESPSVAIVDAAGFVTAIAPGMATIRASAGSVSATTKVRVVSGSVRRLTIQPATTSARTGDVLRFKVSILPAGGAQLAVRWSVSGDGASIDADGIFVAEEPGTYVITASRGDRAASSSVAIAPRNVQRPLEVVGRTPLEEFQTLEESSVGPSMSERHEERLPIGADAQAVRPVDLHRHQARVDVTLDAQRRAVEAQDGDPVRGFGRDVHQMLPRGLRGGSEHQARDERGRSEGFH